MLAEIVGGESRLRSLTLRLAFHQRTRCGARPREHRLRPFTIPRLLAPNRKWDQGSFVSRQSSLSTSFARACEMQAQKVGLSLVTVS